MFGWRHRFLIPVLMVAMATVGSCGDDRDARQDSTSSPSTTTTRPITQAPDPTTGNLGVPGCDLMRLAVPDAVALGNSESRLYVTGVLLEDEDGLVLCEVANGIVTSECDTRRLPVEGVTLEELEAEGVSGEDASFPITLLGELVDGVLHVETPRYIGSATIVLHPGVNYSTRPTRVPLVLVTPPASGWTARDSVACGGALGSLWLRSGNGWMFVVPTSGLMVDDAIEQVLDSNSLTDVTVGDTSFGPWAGRKVAATYVGPSYRVLSGALPYHTVVEDVPPIDSASAERRVEVHVVATRAGVMSVVLLTDPSGMEELRAEALALASTIEVIPTDPGCADEEWADKVCGRTVDEDPAPAEPLPTDAPGCGVATGQSAIEPGANIPQNHAYVVERADAYIGIVVPHMATEQVIDGFTSVGTFVGTDNGGISTYRRGAGDSLEYLGLVIDHQHGNVTTDAIQLTTNGDDVHLAASCPSKALALYPGSFPGSCHPGVSGALQHWTVDHDGQFTETSCPHP
jgi:hypothetical protein